MTGTGPPYPIHLRARIVALVRQGRSPEELAAVFGLSPATIRSWVAQADRSGGPCGGGPTTGERRGELGSEGSAPVQP